MRAFLLAAGEGSRLKPFTDNIPKCLLPIGSTNMIDIWYHILEKLTISDVLINTSYLAEQVSDHVKSLNTSINTHIVFEKKLLGSAGTIKKNKDFIMNDPFWIIYADTLTTVNLSSLLATHRKNNPILTLGVFHSSTPELGGVVNLDNNNRIIDFVEKPNIPLTNLVNSGIMIASPDIITHIPDKFPCDISFDLLPKLVGKMYGELLDGYVYDIGTIKNYNKVQKDWPYQRNKLKI